MSNWSNNTNHIELALQYYGEWQEGNVETAGSRHPSVRHQRFSFLPEVERRLLKLAIFQQSGRRQISLSTRQQAETQGYYECGECALTTRKSHLTLISKMTLFDSTLSSRFWCLIDGMFGWFGAEMWKLRMLSRNRAQILTAGQRV